MKAKLVSALQSERRLHRVSCAEPQVVGLAIQTTPEWKPDTMGKFILRGCGYVEPEKIAVLANLSFVRPRRRLADKREEIFWGAYPGLRSRCSLQPGL